MFQPGEIITRFRGRASPRFVKPRFIRRESEQPFYGKRIPYGRDNGNNAIGITVSARLPAGSVDWRIDDEHVAPGDSQCHGINGNFTVPLPGILASLSLLLLFNAFFMSYRCMYLRSVLAPGTLEIVDPELSFDSVWFLDWSRLIRVREDNSSRSYRRTSAQFWRLSWVWIRDFIFLFFYYYIN